MFHVRLNLPSRILSEIHFMDQTDRLDPRNQHSCQDCSDCCLGASVASTEMQQRDPPYYSKPSHPEQPVTAV